MTRKMWLPVPELGVSEQLVHGELVNHGESSQEELCLIMALVGVANIVASSLQGACFKIFSELQQLGIWPNLGCRGVSSSLQ